MSSIKTLSVIFHVLLLVGLLYGQHLAMAKYRAGKRTKKKITMAYKAGRSAAPAQPPRPQAKVPKAPPKPTDPKPATAATADANGDADVTVAMAVFYPTPKPDLSTLPHGTHGDVVVDVIIDEDGKVVDTRVDQSLSQGVDDAVLEVIETWTFQPAMKAGKPVASEQQLLFHYDRA